MSLFEMFLEFSVKCIAERQKAYMLFRKQYMFLLLEVFNCIIIKIDIIRKICTEIFPSFLIL